MSDILTYDVMVKQITSYFSDIEKMPDLKKSHGEAELREHMGDYFAPNFVSRMCTDKAATLFTHQDWINLLMADCSGDRYRITNNEYPYFWSVDERKKCIGGMIREQVWDGTTGKMKVDFLTSNYMGFTVIDGKPKFQWELIVFMKDAPFQIETLDGYTPNQPWFDLLPHPM